jgi:hypothetical protein
VVFSWLVLMYSMSYKLLYVTENCYSSKSCLYNTTIIITHGSWLINSKSSFRIHQLVISINYICLIIAHGLWINNSKSLIRIHQLVISINYICLIITPGPWPINSKSLIRIHQLVISINYVCLIITHGPWLINSKSLIKIYRLVISINYVCYIIALLSQNGFIYISSHGIAEQNQRTKNKFLSKP